MKIVSQKSGTEKKLSWNRTWTFGLRVLCDDVVTVFDRNVAQIFLYTNVFNAITANFKLTDDECLILSKWYVDMCFGW